MLNAHFFPRLLLRFDVNHERHLFDPGWFILLSMFPRKKGRPLSLSLRPLSASVSLISARVSIPLLITDNTCALFHQPERKPPCVSWIFIVRAETFAGSSYTRTLLGKGREIRSMYTVSSGIIWFKGRRSVRWISETGYYKFYYLIIEGVIDEISIWFFCTYILIYRARRKIFDNFISSRAKSDRGGGKGQNPSITIPFYL